MKKHSQILNKSINIFCFIIIFCLYSTNYFYSQPIYLNLNTETNLRFEKTFYNQIELHTNIKPFQISETPTFDSLNKKYEIATNKRFIYKLLNNNILEYKSSTNKIYLNPILNLAPEFGLNPKQTLSNYRAGLTIGGNLGKQFAFQLDGFYAFQSFYNNLVPKIDSGEIVPGYGEFINKNGRNYHFASITGYLSYTPWKYLNLQTGIGGNFWGDGYRSLFLSDNSSKYPFFKASINVWRFKYQWLFGYLRDFNTEIPNLQLNSKLLFSHYLSWNATKWLNINFFESIVSNPVDSVGVTYFNINYLNPVIFFRPVEFSGGSADNALLGFGFKIKLYKKYQFYGQMVIDEFVWSQMKSGSGWWGNKFGIQAGIKAFDIFNLKDLYFQLEYNAVRPYAYSYSNSILNYGNHFQPLAHPTGANFGEGILLAHYHKNRYSLLLKTIISSSGMDTDSVSYGQDIYKPYYQRQGDYNNSFKQGLETSFYHIELKVSWLINSNLNHSFFLSVISQKQNSNTTEFKNTYISLGIKYLLYNDNLDYL